jgi:hypothetical protein
MRASWLLSLSLVIAGGCPAPTPTDEPTPTEPTDTDPPSNTPRTDVTGSAVDVDGNPVEGLDIRFCRGSLCRNGETDASGAWTSEGGATMGFPRAEAVPTSLELLLYDSLWATTFTVLDLEAETPRDIPIVMVEDGPATALSATPTWVTVGDGLRIEVASDVLEPPNAFVDPTTEVSGVLVPPAAHPPLDGFTDVLAVWYVGPFDHKAPAGLPMEIDNTFGLTDGQTVQVQVGDYTTSTWLDAGTLTASGALLTGDARLPVLSTVVITGPVE